MGTNDRIKYDALKLMKDKYLVTFNLNAVTGYLDDAFDDEEAVKNVLIKMDIKHDQDINGILTSDENDDIAITPAKDKKTVLTSKGNKDLEALIKQDDKEIAKKSAQ